MLSENESLPSDRRVWDISVTLRHAGCEVVALCPQGSQDERARLEVRDGVTIHRYPLRFAASGTTGYLREYLSALWRTWRLVRRLTRECAFDAVHACNPPDFLLFAAWPARRCGARLIFDHHDLTPELFLTRFGGRHRLLHRLTLLVERACFAVADVVISTNESYREVAQRRGRKRPEATFVVRNGPDLRRLQRARADPAMRRGRRFLISYVGVMAPQDGVDHALRALALLAAGRDDWHAVLAGDGQSRGALERLAAELGLSEQVEFAGWLSDEQIARLLASSDVCLAPEPSSPLNDLSTMVKIAEYMAASRPVVSYGLRESRFTAGEAAAFAAMNDVASFAARIAELLDDPARRARMGRIGRQRVERELSWQHSERSLLNAYRCALNGTGERLRPGAPMPREATASGC